jgi:excisionase family DNA binding protein
MNGRLLDATEVAERLNVPVSWVRGLTRSGAMPCVELGRYRRYDWSAVEAWLEKWKTPGRTIALRGRRAA